MTDRQYTYARFWKCALQVNPHGYSGKYRGQDHGLDAEAYAQALLDACRKQEIDVVGLADHGSVAESKTIRQALTEAGIVVFPGFEVATTEKVHWVCLFPEDTEERNLDRYLGNLGLTDPEDGVRPSKYGGEDFFRVLSDELGGFFFAAHAVNDNGVLKRGQLEHLWKNPLLKAAQIPKSIEYLDAQYKQIFLNQNPDYHREPRVAAINAKDVAKPEDLANPKASTFIKMTRPCFASLLLAFKDPESRVRLEHQMQEQFYSRIESIRIEGGYFDGLDARLSGHLNTVIGGRGSGKSTFLECLRYALDIQHKVPDAEKLGNQIVAANLGKDGGRVIVELCSANNNMEHYKIIRRYGEPPRVIDKHKNESTLHPRNNLLPKAEFYGQNEIYELAKDPGARARILDRFLPQDAEKQSRLGAVLRNLTENGEQLDKAQKRKEEIEMQIAELPRLQEKVGQFKEQGLDQKLQLVPLLEKERQLVPRMRQEVERVQDARRHFEDELPDLTFLSDKALEGLTHADRLRQGRQILENLAAELRRKLDEIHAAATAAGTALTPIAEQLKQAMAESAAQLEKEFAKLPAMAGKTGQEIGRAYQSLLREIERIKPAESQLQTANAAVDELKQKRRNLLGELADLRSDRTAAKRKAVKKLNRRLTGKLRITVVPDGLRRPLREFLQHLPGVGTQKTQWTEKAAGLTVMGLIDAIRKGKDALLNKQWGLPPSVAEVLTRLNAAQLHELETIDIEDRVDIELNVSHTGAERFRALDQLSIGQQCTAILHLLLLDNPDPLIMDQPEDNLDNAFIAERIVKELRSAKTERQFLFATHNANIPVFGDAEWIGVCTATVDGAKMPPDRQGAIDIPEIRDHAAEILEGGKDAFTQRKEKYGY